MLSIRGLTKTYGSGVRALDGITLDIPAGMFGLLGPLRQKQKARELLGYLPQDSGFIPR